MAPAGKKGKKNKEKAVTVTLQNFLADGNSGTTSDTATIKVKSWADEVEDDEALSFSARKEQGSFVLPTAPRAARGPDVPDDRIPTQPPFTAYIANLPYDVNSEDVMQFFGHLNIKSVRLPRDGDHETGKPRGIGYADFEDRASLVEALTMNEQRLQSRKIRIDLATHAGRGDRDGGGRGGDRYGGGSRYNDELGEEHKSSNWRTDPPPQSSCDDRDRRDNDNRRDFDNRRDQDNRRDFDSRRDFDNRRGGGGFDRYEPPRDDRRDRGYGGYRDDRGSGGYGNDRSYGGDRYGDRYDRDRYGDRGDRFDGRERSDRYDGRRRSPEPPRERPKLQLAKRSAEADRSTDRSEASSSIFGGAKPVDTTKKEAEIEKKLQQEQIKISLPRKSEGDRDVTPESDKASASGNAKPVDPDAGEREVEESVKRLDLEKKDGKERHDEQHHNGESDRPHSRSSVKVAKKPKAADIFGNAKPVDTTVREREVEERRRTRLDSEHKDKTHKDSWRPDRKRGEIHSDGRGGGRYRSGDGRKDGGSNRRGDHERDDHLGKRQEQRHDEGRDERSPPPIKKHEEAKAPNFVGSNKFSSLQQDGEDDGSAQDSN